MIRVSAKAARAARLSMYFAFVFVALGWASARAVRASVREATFRAGRSLATLSELTGDAATVSVNGSVFHRSGTTTDDAPSVVLDRFEAYCNERPNALSRALAKSHDVPSYLKLDGVTGNALRHGILRDGDANGGMVVCFAREAGDTDEGDDAGAAFQRLVRTGDLASMGHFRYAFAERLANGSTRITTIWSDGSMDVRAMFPETGDAAGSDSTIAPRPPSARRVITARAEGVPHAARVYASTATPAALRAFYDDALTARGLARVDMTTDSATADGRAYLRPDGFLVVVSFVPEDGATYVSLIEAGTAGAPNGTVGHAGE